MKKGSDGMERKMDWQQLLIEKRYNTSNIFYLRGDSAYNMDSMKIIKSEPFQKLPEKTHLFPIESWECSRTSMLYSLEVSYFSKMIVHKFAERNMRKTVTAKEIAKMSNTVSAAALLQEIGLPAFGYCGEACIRAWFQENLTSLTYEGQNVVDLLKLEQRYDLENLSSSSQSLRITRKLHDEPWRKTLNLTYPILNTVLNRSFICTERQHQPEVNYYQSEKRFYQKISEEMDIINNHPLTLIIQAASDLAYTTSGIKEALGKGLISSQELVSYLLDYIDETQLTYGQLYQYREILVRKKQLLAESQDDSAILLWMEDLQMRFVINAASSFNKKYTAIMSGTYSHDLFFETDVEPLIRGLQVFINERIIGHSQLRESESLGIDRLTELLGQLVPAAIYFEEEQTVQQKSLNRHLSNHAKESYRADIAGESEISQGTKLYHRLMMAVDFLSELTDEQAITLAEKLTSQAVIEH